jgi:hypothetical protein
MCEGKERGVHRRNGTTSGGGERKMIWTILAVIGLIAVLVWLF